MESATASASGSQLKHAAFISHTRADRDWAIRLRHDLEAQGIRSVMADFTTVKASDSWSGALDEALDASRALIVLWTPEAIGAEGVQREVSAFNALARWAQTHGEPARLIIPIFFGEESIRAAPPELQTRQGVLIDPEIYAEGADAATTAWTQAIEKIGNVLRAGKPSEIEPTAGAQPAKESSVEALNRARAWVILEGETEAGWLLSDDLAIMLAKSDPNGRELAVRTAAGMSNANVIPWSQTQMDSLDGFVALRLDPPLDLPQPLPIGPPFPGRLIEVWGWPLDHLDALGEIGEPLEDGSFDLDLPGARVAAGAAVWDSKWSRFVGITVADGNRRPRLLPTEAIGRLAGSRSRPRGHAPPPSARIHDDSWTIEDRLDYALYARAIGEFIRHPDTKPPLVIGVQGPWGQGKTSLMRIAQDRLDPNHADLDGLHDRPSAPAPDGPSEVTFRDLRDSLDGDVALGDTQPSEIRSVWFNAWKYQSSEALWAGLAHSILTQLPARLSRRARELFWLKLQLRRIDASAVRRDIHRAAFDWLLPRLIGSVVLAMVVVVTLALLGAAAVVSALSGCGAAVLLTGISWARAQSKALERNLEGSYLRYVSQPDYAEKMGYFHQVEEDMHRALDLLAPDSEPTVIFIDDLDRCSPAKISEILEAINLFLSGEYPNCVFVLGIDAEVVAAAMEIVHKDVIGELDGRGDELGWRFMDKFIQLSFVMPRLSERQKEAYLISLLGADSAAEESVAAAQAAAGADLIHRELEDGKLKPEDAAKRVGELSANPATVESSGVRQVAEDVIALGAQDFSDADPETVEALHRQLSHLSDNPRTIKRAVNLYRFYRFIAWAREASSPDLEAADSELIARWVVIAARWPQIVHWLQVNGQHSGDPEALLLAAWRSKEPELCAFLEGGESVDLKRAMACGLW